MREKVLLAAVSIALFQLISCGSPENASKKPLPPNIVKEISSANDDFAPSQRSSDEKTVCDPCRSEFSIKSSEANEGVNTSGFYLKDILSGFIPEEAKSQKAFVYFIQNNTEAVSFINQTDGFFSVSHMPDFISARNMNLSLSLPLDESGFGGSDIYEFKLEDGEYKITHLGKSANSIFWDSHPFAIKDTNCNVLLLWSSAFLRFQYSTQFLFQLSNKSFTPLFYVSQGF